MSCDNDQQDITEDYLSQIIINPAIKSENYSQGLCGEWSKIQNTQQLTDLFLKNIYSKNEELSLIDKFRF